MDHIRIKECRTINKEEAGVVGAVSSKSTGILVEALVRTLANKEEEASMEGVGVTGVVEVDSK